MSLVHRKPKLDGKPPAPKAKARRKPKASPRKLPRRLVVVGSYLVAGAGERRVCGNEECLEAFARSVGGDAHCPEPCEGWRAPGRAA